MEFPALGAFQPRGCGPWGRVQCWARAWTPRPWRSFPGSDSAIPLPCAAVSSSCQNRLRLRNKFPGFVLLGWRIDFGAGGGLEHFYVFSFFSPPDFFPPHSEPNSASPGDNAMTAALKRAGGDGFVQEGEKNWDEGGREGGREGLRRRGDATLLLVLAMIIPSRLLGAGAASPFPGRWDPCPPPLLLAFPAFIFMDFLYFIFMFPP